ncbi:MULTISPECIES: ABC transporter substrate-binding protein [Marivita]|uniref:ABC transporter substrate-binding protein n=2 Tax=Marivita cryptomonadis TaxID=505252 RepID=A0A9Q2P047_9RHOB|nr:MULTISPECIES: ABC transporter substrate-binding protein [Marivita]MCR9169879.1 ABC transporter substrate-binding protein [Paracoccaceae bacterium]MBM2324063.1 ABC transporter substrate-binding protein [Marivita cryptomonadis]MBM2333653.1 ABC transporter substrate-binding protein [Marivita cryptomonadis]MBM2343230.1 ABC transporter substrate-binding protein [Marivita cryptomonadis]MBM2347902.1 ABC transporter substrate-binding protein [Marivita cryptomonadis]
MCERCGNTYHKIQEASRRGFLKGGAAAAASLAIPAGLLSPGMAAAQGLTRIKATHGGGLCNLGIFLAKERKLAEADGVDLDFVVTPTTTDVVTLFGAGMVDVSVIPYSNFITLVDAGAPVQIVAGAGVEGCILIGSEEISSPADLKGKTIGTFQADTLEVLPYDYMTSAGMEFADAEIKYFNTSPELAAAFINGAIDAVSHIEPYATQCLQERAGSSILTDGLDLYGKGYSDCVLAARTPLLEENPDAVKAVIKAMMTAQYQSETDTAAALATTQGTYYKTSLEALTLAQSRQPVMIDQRNNTDFFVERSVSMQKMGYVKNTLPDSAVNWTLLEEVIAENADLYDSLNLKTAA